MNTVPMINMHQASAPWLWQLADRQAATLVPQAVPRWLHVEAGCVWVTAQNAGPHAPDLWLGPGESLALPAGSSWVLQAWPQAQMTVLAPPALKAAVAAPAPAAAVPAARAWWQSSWFWPWVLPEAQGQRLPVMAP